MASSSAQIRVGHSADPDDAFMVWALQAGKVDMRGLELEPVASDIETLNEWALDGKLEVTALSAGVYPRVADRYAVLPFGASFGEGYGPIVVAREQLAPRELRHVEIAIPGRMTTAYLALRLALDGELTRATDFPFDQILDEVVSGRSRAGLVIHEGQLTYESLGLVKVLDLGEWWLKETGLPLPLGLVAIRRDVARRADIMRVLRDAIDAGLAHRDEALAFAKRFGRGIDDATADRFVAMYVNELTLDMGSRGRKALTELLRRANPAVVVEFA